MSNQDQYTAKNNELIAAFEELIRRANNEINVIVNKALGEMAFAANLQNAPMGNLDEVLKRLQVQNVAGRETIGNGPELMLKSAYGLGATAGTFGISPSQSLDDIPTSFFVHSTADSPSDAPRSAQGGGVKIGSSSNWNALLWFDLARNIIYSRSASSGGQASSWASIYSTSNTTRDSNGVLRAASPIFRLALDSEAARADEEGQQYEPAGAGAANSKAQGVTAIRESAGVYRVTGSLGWRADGWQFANIQDGNGLPLLWVDVQEENEDLIVHTYHRTHPSAPPFARNEIKGYADGDPIDIPEGRFISLRLAMPEPDSPEPYESEQENV